MVAEFRGRDRGKVAGGPAIGVPLDEWSGVEWGGWRNPLAVKR